MSQVDHDQVGDGPAYPSMKVSYGPLAGGDVKLARLCPHDRYEEHPCIDGRWVSQARMFNLKPEERPLLTFCPGGEFLPEGALVIEKETALQIIADQEWTVQERQGRHLNGGWHYLTESEINGLLDALASQVGESE